MDLRTQCLEKITVVLPSLDPDYKFDKVVAELVDTGFKNIVIVDDGSCEEKQKHFLAAEEYSACHVLHHGVNKGKGRALKTAFNYILENCPDSIGAVTIDGDGQHLTKDIIACVERMLQENDKVVLGCRDFDMPGVPPRSVAGNKTTSRFFRILFNIKLSDTQTGLRAIPVAYLKRFAGINGERFEYETNMLLWMKRWGIDFYEQKIETVYDPDDYSSHYNAVKDSWRIMKVMGRFLATGSGAKYLFSSVAAIVLDYIIYNVLLGIFGFSKEAVFHLVATFASSLLNFNLNKFWVFGKPNGYFKDMLGYYAVCVPRTLLSTLFSSLLISGVATTSMIAATFVRLVVDGVLFVACYYIQKKWVFKKK